VQKSAALRSLIGEPSQHGCPAPPQPVQLPSAWHVPLSPPQLADSARQKPPTQHPLSQVLSWQQGSPTAPQLVDVPPQHTFPDPVSCPLAAQVLPTQQPPPRHASSAQQAAPSAPQTSHTPDAQVPFAQSCPSATH